MDYNKINAMRNAIMGVVMREVFTMEAEVVEAEYVALGLDKREVYGEVGDE